ncbi:LysR substrate-binding domain-containing protein [Streptomyces sp. NPDC056402]|uniref:LysR substrate-binding domain-containing protein n=1 Tax=Streptomyces sp. NPDC056402 TaxID=3345810 RepID=UPI0035E3123F
MAPLTVTGAGEEELAVLLPAGHPLAGRAGVRLDDLADARRIDAPGVGLPLAAARACVRYHGTDLLALGALAAAGHGLVLLPRRVARAAGAGVAVPLSAPRLVRRTELLSPGRPTGMAAALAARLAG